MTLFAVPETISTMEKSGETPVKPVVTPDVKDINLTSNHKNPAEGLSKLAEPRLSMVGPAESQDPKCLAEALQTALSQATTARPRAQAWPDLTK